MMRRGIIASSGNKVACLFPMEGLTGPEFQPLVVDNKRQEVGVVYPAEAPAFPLWMAATPDTLWYSTSDSKWVGWRVLQMAINKIDSGSARLALTDSTFGSSIDLIFDAASNSWTGLVNGVEQETTTGMWSEVVTFRVNGTTGDVVAMVGDTVMAEQLGMFNAVEFGGLISWNGANSISGDEFAAAIYSSASAINPETLDSGNSDWCGNEIPIAKLENVADDVSIVGSLDYLEIEDVVQVDTTLPENTTPNVGITGALEYLEIETVEETT